MNCRTIIAEIAPCIHIFITITAHHMRYKDSRITTLHFMGAAVNIFQITYVM